MPQSETYKGQKPAWCPGCGNFQILKTFREAMEELGLKPHEIMLVSGIGQAAKLPHYTKGNTFNGLHGRALPVAAGVRLASHGMPVIVTTGDGDCYGEGGNHLMHNIRRNIDMKLFVHNNEIYGLTKGQASPTSMEGMKTKVQTFGVLSEQMNPLALAIALDCPFVARSFAGDAEHLRSMMVEAVRHKGFALLDILQPCVTFNKLNTYDWYRERVYKLGDDYDPADRVEAFRTALEWGDRIPIGVIFRNDRKTLEERIPVIAEKPLKDMPLDLEARRGVLEEFR